MTSFRFHDAHIALRQLAEARVAIALIETLSGFFLAMHTKNLSAKFQLYRLPD
jgi:hypothetical protein